MDEVKNQGDGLEQLAKAAAEGAQFEFNPAAWTAMEKKLDAPKRGFFWWWFSGIIGVILLALLFIFNQPVEKDVLNERQTSGLKSNTDTGKEGTKTTNKDKKGNSPGNAQLAAPSSDESIEQRPTEGDNLEDTYTNNETLVERTRTTIQDEGLVAERSNEQFQPESKRDEVEYFDPTQPIADQSGTGNQNTGLYEASFGTIIPSWSPREYLFDLSLKPMTIDSANYHAPDLDSLQQFKRWSFGVLVSLDLSATGLDGFTDPGTMIGLQAEYRISRKWSVLSGVSYSIKKYRALGTEYATPGWIAARPDDFLGATARCLVIDIPLNVRRYFATKKGNQWFVNTGVSTYLMLREDYTYEYTHPRPNWLNEWSVSNRNNHFAGIANLSVGYETSLNKKFALGIEPFVKLPLTGIGEGQVKFLSFGTNLVIKLR